MAQLQTYNPLQEICTIILASLDSSHTRRVYSARLTAFIESGYPLTRTGVMAHIASLKSAGIGASSINQTLSAIKKLTEEALERGIIDPTHAFSIRTIKQKRVSRVRLGNWLTLEQAGQLLMLPDRKSLSGKRDSALLAILLGCGLRRAELSSLKWDQFQVRESRTILTDIQGKGQKIRAVPIPSWASDYLQAYRDALVSVATSKKQAWGADQGAMFWSVRGGFPDNPLSETGIHWIVSEYAIKLGVPEIAQLRPHDLRRSFAKLARAGGAELEQVQISLGHSSLQTTERYLGGKLEIRAGRAAGDKIAL